MNTQEARIVPETALICAQDPSRVNDLRKLFDGDVSADTTHVLLEELHQDWLNRGVELVALAPDWRLQSRPEMRVYPDRLHPEKPPEYSRAVMETLAITACRQPATYGDIEGIRGVTVNTQVVKQIEDCGWTEVIGHRDVPGRPVLYATTKQFLDGLDLRSLDELPPLEDTRVQAQASLLEQGATEFEGGAIAMEELTALVNDVPEGVETSVAEAAGSPVVEAFVEATAETLAQPEMAPRDEPALETEPQAVSAAEVVPGPEHKTPVESPAAAVNGHSQRHARRAVRGWLEPLDLKDVVSTQPDPMDTRMLVDVDAQPPRQGGGDGTEVTPHREGLRRGLRNLVASRRQQQEGQPEGKVTEAGAANAGQAVQSCKSRASRARKLKEAVREPAVVVAEGVVPTEQVPAEGQGERHDPRGRLGKNRRRQGEGQPAERAEYSERTEGAAGKNTGDRGKQRNRNGKPQGKAGGQNQNRGSKGPKGGKDPEDVFQYVISGAYDPEADADGASQLPKTRELTSDDDAPKLYKILADAGSGSRCDVEDLILQGRTSVNGLLTHIGRCIPTTDQVRMSDELIQCKLSNEPPCVLPHHKPASEIVSRSDPEGHPTAFDASPRMKTGKWVVVGCLGFNTEGLPIFTISGDIVSRFMHPCYGVECEYAVRTLGELAETDRQKLLHGIPLQDSETSFLCCVDGGGESVNYWYHVALTEDRNREVRRMFEVVNLTASRLIRTRYSNFILSRGLKRGRWQEVSAEDVRTLMDTLGMKVSTVGSGGGQDRRGNRCRGPTPVLMGPMSSGSAGEVNFQSRGMGIENGSHAQPAQRRPSSSRQSDPMQTSVGCINVGGLTTFIARTRIGGCANGHGGAGMGGDMRDGNRIPGNKRPGKSAGGMPNGNKASCGGGKRGGKH